LYILNNVKHKLLIHIYYIAEQCTPSTVILPGYICCTTLAGSTLNWILRLNAYTLIQYMLYQLGTSQVPVQTSDTRSIGRYKPKTYKRRTVQTLDTKNIGLVQTSDSTNVLPVQTLDQHKRRTKKKCIRILRFFYQKVFYFYRMV